MKKKMIYLATTFAFIFHSDGKAQIVKEIISKYPASVVYRIYCVENKTTIPAGKQKILAEYFLNQDKLAKKALMAGGKIQDISVYYVNDTRYLKGVLSPLEFNDYLFDENNNNKLEKAIKFRKQLNLTEMQLNDLLNAESRIELEKNGQTTNSEKQDEMVIKTLSLKQDDHLLELIAQPLARKQTQETLIELLNNGIISFADSDKILKENLTYFLRAGITDLRFSNKNNIRIDSVRGTYFAFKPFSLLKLDMVNSNLPESQFSGILKDRKTLSLSGKQVDSLIVYTSSLEKLKMDYKSKNPYQKYDATPFEAKGIVRTLNSVQYDTYLRSKNKTNAIVNEKKKWTRLKQYGLNNGVDSVQANRQLINYELNVLVANERYHNDDSPLNSEKKKLVERNKPELYKKLDLAVSTISATGDAKKTLAW